MVIPASPVIPGNEDGGCVPVAGAVRVLACAVADGVDDRCYPRGSATGVAFGMIGILSGGNHPGHLPQIAGGTTGIGQHVGRLEIHVIDPVGSSAGPAAGFADMTD